MTHTLVISATTAVLLLFSIMVIQQPHTALTTKSWTFTCDAGETNCLNDADVVTSKAPAVNNANAAGGLDFTTNKDTTATQTIRGIDWTSMCNTVQIALVQSCGTLVNLSDGTLTTAGETAFGCITNGALILAAGTLLGQAGPTLLMTQEKCLKSHYVL